MTTFTLLHHMATRMKNIIPNIFSSNSWWAYLQTIKHAWVIGMTSIYGNVTVKHSNCAWKELTGTASWVFSSCWRNEASFSDHDLRRAAVSLFYYLSDNQNEKAHVLLLFQTIRRVQWKEHKRLLCHYKSNTSSLLFHRCGSREEVRGSGNHSVFLPMLGYLTKSYT